MAKRFISGLGAGYVALIVNALMMIILMPFFLHHLGEEMTGLYIMIASLTNVMNFGIGWMAEASSVTIAARSHAHRAHYLVKPIYRLQQMIFGGYGIIMCVMMIVSSFILPYVWQPADPEQLVQVQLSLWLFGLHYVIYLLHNGDLSFLISQLQIDFANYCKASYYVIFCVLALALLHIWPSLYIVFVAQLITTLIMGAFSQLYLRKYHLSWIQFMRPRRILWRAILMRVGGPIAAIAVMWGVVMYADTALVGFLLGPAAAAHFFAGTKIADTLALMITRISETATPYFARLKKPAEEETRKFFYLQFQRILLFLSIIAAAGYGLFGEDVMKLWLGSSAPELPPALFWLAGMTIIFRTLIKFEHNVIISLQSVKKIIPTSFIETVLRVGALVVCVHLFGLPGVLISFIAVYLFGVYWVIKYYSMQAAGIRFAEGISQLITPLALAGAAIIIWYAFYTWLWPQGYTGAHEFILPAILLGTLALLVPLFAMPYLPLSNYKKLASLFEEMTR